MSQFIELEIYNFTEGRYGPFVTNISAIVSIKRPDEWLSFNFLDGAMSAARRRSEDAYKDFSIKKTGYPNSYVHLKDENGKDCLFSCKNTYDFIFSALNPKKEDINV